MQVNVVFYALSAVLNVMTCVTVYLSKGVTTVNMFVLNIMIPSAVNAVLLLVFGFLQGDEENTCTTTCSVWHYLYHLVDTYVAYHYAVVGVFFHVLTYLLFVKPIFASRIFQNPKKYFIAAQLVAAFFGVLSASVVIFGDIYYSGVEVRTFRRITSLLLYNIPCFLWIVLLIISYLVSIVKLVTFHSGSFQSTKERKTKTALVFFTPIVVLFVGNLCDFGVTIAKDLNYLTHNPIDPLILDAARGIMLYFVGYFYPLQMLIYPICALIAFPEYRDPVRIWVSTSFVSFS